MTKKKNGTPGGGPRKRTLAPKVARKRNAGAPETKPTVAHVEETVAASAAGTGADVRAGAQAGKVEETTAAAVTAERKTDARTRAAARWQPRPAEPGPVSEPAPVAAADVGPAPAPRAEETSREQPRRDRGLALLRSLVDRVRGEVRACTAPLRARLVRRFPRLGAIERLLQRIV